MDERKAAAGADLQYRPYSYFWAEERGIQLSSRIQGARRRALYVQSLESGEEMPAVLTEPSLPHNLRQALGRIHPQFMGGEYLTRPRRGEVVLAGLTINSTTADTFAIYVRRSGDRLRYRAVDEYEGSSLGEKSTLSSSLPLTLKQLVNFAIKAWGVTECLDGNFCEDNYPEDECQDFLTELSSDFYPDFEWAMRLAVDDWLHTVRAPADIQEAAK